MLFLQVLPSTISIEDGRTKQSQLHCNLEQSPRRKLRPYLIRGMDIRVAYRVFLRLGECFNFGIIFRPVGFSGSIATKTCFRSAITTSCIKVEELST